MAKMAILAIKSAILYILYVLHTAYSTYKSYSFPCATKPVKEQILPRAGHEMGAGHESCGPHGTVIEDGKIFAPENSARLPN
jgi:hypothetical protein